MAVKRAMDVCGALLGLVLFSPLLALAALALRLTQGSPVLFRQLRPGWHGQAFTILKLRTMRSLREGETLYESDAARVTPLGRFLRATSIDELPELWNVLRGDMSLVGPRPLLEEYLSEYSPDERRRHDMRPGITGWAAVNGRNAIPFRERLALDVWYVDHHNLLLDLKILALTAYQVLRRENAKVTESIEELGFPLPIGEARSAAAASQAGERKTPPRGEGPKGG